MKTFQNAKFFFIDFWPAKDEVWQNPETLIGIFNHPGKDKISKNL